MLTARLQIQTALRNGRTYLKKAYCTTPFKIADITEDKSQTLLQLMLMTSSPGVLDGDNYDINIEVAAGCELELQTQSYQRLFNMEKGASQSMQVLLNENASFNYLPHPTVPHKASDFVTKSNVYLSGGCSLIWGEVLTCGRKLSGEVFAFSRYHNITQIFLNDKLVVKENLLVTPLTTQVSAIGQWEGYTHQSSLLYINEAVAAAALVTAIHQLLLPEDVCFGVSLLPVNGIVVRMLGHKAEQLYNLQKKIAAHIINQAESTKKAVFYAV